MTSVPTALVEIRNENDPVQVLESWKGMAWDRFNRSTTPALLDFYEGYATAIEDSIRLLKAQAEKIVEGVVDEASDVAEVVKKSHKLRTLVIVGVAVGGFYVYKRRKEEKERQKV